MKYYLMLIAAAILLACDFVIQKKFQSKTDGSVADCLIFSLIFGVSESVIFFAANGFKLSFTPFSCLMASAASVLAMGYIMLGFLIMKSESVAYYTLFVMTGGMAMPYLWGLVFLNEEFSFLRLAGLILIAAAIVVMNADKSKLTPKTLILCALVFIMNGAVSVISKQHQLSPAALGENDFIIYTGLARAVFAGVALIFMRNKINRQKYTPRAIALPVLSSVVSGVSFALQLIPAKYVPATALYPFITGGSIIFTAAAGRIFVKEKINKRTAAGLALCLAGTLMFL